MIASPIGRPISGECGPGGMSSITRALTAPGGGGSVAPAVWTPASLFAANEQGVWYDPSDFSTLYQDSAGTIPVTAVEQPVGKMLDKSGNGNHAVQATTAQKPVLSARVNLLTKSAAFSDAAWTKEGSSVVDNNATAPDGTTTASTFTVTGATEHRVYQVSNNGTQTFSVYAKAGTGRYLSLSSGVAANSAIFDLQLGTIYSQAGTVSNVSIAPDLLGYYRCKITMSASYLVINAGSSVAMATAGAASSGDNSTVLLWHPQAEQGTAATTYQRVNTASDYDTVGFKHYLKFDGVDDGMVSNSIDFTATDKMTVWAGVRLAADTAGVFVELSVATATNLGSFYITARENPGSFGFRVTGTAIAGYNSAVKTIPFTGVFAMSANIAGASVATEVMPRINGVADQTTQGGSSCGTGNFGNYPLYIGRRGGASLPFNGHLYVLIVRGAASSAAQITSGETYTATQTGVTI